MSGRRVLVTGASRGIGRAIAIRLAADGFCVCVHYGRDQAAADATLEKVLPNSPESRLLQFDVADRAACRAVLEAELAEHGAFYGLVSNAGIARDAAFPALRGEDWDAVLRTDLDSFFNVIQPCVMPMIRARQGGRILTVSSLSGQIGNRGQVNYSAAKAGIIGASKALAVELASRGITVNCIAPGLIDTDMVDAEQLAPIIDAIPLRRLGTADEVAALAGYVMSDAAAYLTRQVISLNGGLA